MRQNTRVALYTIWGGLTFFALILLVFWRNQAQLKEFLVRPDGVVLKALFSPQDDVVSVLTQLIEREQKSICLTGYIITQRDIVAELVRARTQRGVNVTIITDFQMATDAQRNQQIRALCQAVDVYVVQPADNGIMHNKYALFESNFDQQSIVWTGSFNFTASAQNRNRENVVISNDTQLYDQYKHAFAQLLKEARPAAPLMGPAASAHPVRPPWRSGRRAWAH